MLPTIDGTDRRSDSAGELFLRDPEAATQARNPCAIARPVRHDLVVPLMERPFHIR